MRTAIVMTIGILAPMLGVNIVNVAIKTIGVDLGIGVDLSQWLVTAYILCMGIAIPLSSWVVDRFPAKPVYLGALAVFTVASLAAGLPCNFALLIVWRCVQGLASGVGLQLVQTILMREAGPGNRGRIMAIVGVPAVILPILGPTLGGLIVAYLPWRWVFLINVPLCAVAILLTALLLPSLPVADPHKRLDVPGNILLAAGFCAALYGISSLSGSGRAAGLVALAIGVVILALYVAYALRRSCSKSRHSGLDPESLPVSLRTEEKILNQVQDDGIVKPTFVTTPTPSVVNVRLFRRPTFSSSVLLMMLYSFVSQGSLFVLALYFQQSLGLSALMTGLMLIPQGLGMLVTRSWAGKATDKHDPRLVALIGIIPTLIGTLPFVFLGLGGLGGGFAGYVLLFAALFVRGLGLGIIMVPITACVYTGLTPTQVSEGTTAQRIFQQIGGAVGTALMAIMLACGLGYGWVYALCCLVLLIMLLPLRFMAGAKAATAPVAANDSVV
jgi:MFS family permease